MQCGRAVMALVAVAAVVAAGIPSTASATKPSKRPGGHRAGHVRRAGVRQRLWLGQHRRPRQGAVRDRRPGRPRPASGSEDGRRHDLRQRSAARDPRRGHRRSDRCRLRRSQRVRARHPGRARLRPNRRRRRHLPDRGGRHCDGDRRHRRVVDRNPPATDFFIASGVQYALEKYRGGFLVTDGHHNRVLRVTRAGDISQTIAFGNIVPTGLEVRGKTIYMGQAGPIPHLPRTARS